MTSAPIPIPRKNDSDNSDSDHDVSSDVDSENGRGSRWNSQFSTMGIPLDGGLTTVGTMAYSLTDAQSLQRHQEMISRASGRFGQARSDFSGAQSLPLPRAPFLSSTRESDFESRLMSLPPMSLPESAVLEDVDDTTGRSVPSTFGSLRNSNLNCVTFFKTKPSKFANAALSSSVGDAPFGGGYSLPTFMDRSSRSRVRQRIDGGELKQNYRPTYQKNEVLNDGDSRITSKYRLGCGKDGRIHPSEPSDLVNYDIHDEWATRDENHPSLLGTSLTALGVMKFSGTKQGEQDGTAAISSLGEMEITDGLQKWVTKRTQIVHYEGEATQEIVSKASCAYETREKNASVDREDDFFEPDFLTSLHNPDTVEAFDLDLSD